MNKQFTCCVCYDDSAVPIMDITNSRLLSLNEIDVIHYNNFMIPPNTIFQSCCPKHAICCKCLRDTVLNFNHHPINVSSSMVPCMSFEKICTNDFGFQYYFAHKDICKILSERERIQYLNYVDKYRFPGFEIVKCPRSVTRNGTVEQCNAEILVPIKKIQTRQPGRLVIKCDQCCFQKSCYTCHRIIHSYRRNCSFCIESTERTNPYAFNRYFHKPNKQIDDNQYPLFKNNELTLEIVIQQLKQIINNTDGSILCTNCLSKMYKTEQCNTMTHCKIERCYACGRSGLTTIDLGDHWDKYGKTGCPRYDNGEFWNEIANCNFQCTERQCYSHDIGDCQIEEHQQGITNMKLIRKQAQIYHALYSLPPELTKQTINHMKRDPQLIAFIPTCWSRDHREYLPEFTQLTEIMDIQQHNNNNNDDTDTDTDTDTDIDIVDVDMVMSSEEEEEQRDFIVEENEN